MDEELLTPSGHHSTPTSPDTVPALAQLQFHRRIANSSVRGKGKTGRRDSWPSAPVLLAWTTALIIVTGVPPNIPATQGTLRPRLRFPLLPGLPPPGSRPGSIVGASCVHPKGARQCFPFSGEGRKRMLPRGASSIRGVFLVLTRHERRSRCLGVDRSQKTNGFDTPVYGSAFGERA